MCFELVTLRNSAKVRMFGTRSRTCDDEDEDVFKNYVLDDNDDTVEPRLSGLVGITQNSPSNRGSG